MDEVQTARYRLGRALTCFYVANIPLVWFVGLK